MLWDLIRDFFVVHIFGGHTSQGVPFGGVIGFFTNDSLADYVKFDTATAYVKVGDFVDDNYEMFTNYICFGDWFSTTATIISISIIVVLCCLFVYKIIKLIGGLIR